MMTSSTAHQSSNTAMKKSMIDTSSSSLINNVPLVNGKVTNASMSLNQSMQTNPKKRKRIEFESTAVNASNLEVEESKSVEILEVKQKSSARSKQNPPVVILQTLTANEGGRATRGRKRFKDNGTAVKNDDDEVEVILPPVAAARRGTASTKKG